MDLRNRWIGIATDLRVADPEGVFQHIANSYSHNPDHYHTLRHIAHCLQEFDQVKNFARRPQAIELAIWFHDAVYDPRATDNEEQSAYLLRRLVSTTESEEAARLILATKHQQIPEDPDAALIVDIDLAILGKPEEEFDEYERQIRHEYAWVEDKAFREGRKNVLQTFLSRASIYSTDAFRERYEALARQNLQRSISRLV